MLVLSVAAHAAVIAGAAGRPVAVVPPIEARSFAEGALGRARTARRAQKLVDERIALVREARQQRAEGRLALGHFLLEASRIDAEEKGIDLDANRAAEAYASRLAALRTALEGAGVTHAVPQALGDLKYYGKPGGLMASALADGGGSCEQISQVVGAAVFDAGRPKEIALRYYGGVMADGASHITPIAIDGLVEHDLMSGKIAAPGGVRIEVDELVEIYARAHGLAERSAEVKRAFGNAGGTSESAIASRRAGAAAHGVGAAANGAGAAAHGVGAAANGAGAAANGAGAAPVEGAGDDEDAAPRQPSLIAGMPPNDDRYPGSLPLYAAHALRNPDEGGGGGFELSEEQQARFCPFYVRLGTLSPPSVAIEVSNGGTGAATFIDAEPRKVPGPAILEREATLMRAAETMARKSTTDATDRLVDWACLAALGDVATVDFELAGEHGAAVESVRIHRLGRDKGKAALAAIDWSGEEGRVVARKLLRDYGGQSWILLALEGGERAVMEIAAQARRDLDGWIGLHAALIVWPGTRAKVLSIVAARPLSEQMEVMQAIFLTSDRMRYLAGNLDLDGTVPLDAPSARFLAEYRVFRRLGARLWDGDEPSSTLAAFDRDALANGLDAEGKAALLEYYARNTLALYAQRIEVSPGARPAHNAHPSRVERPMAVTFAPQADPHAGLGLGKPLGPHAWQRPGGMDVVHALREAVERNGHPSLDRVRRCLSYIEAQGQLDPRTLADGLRID